MRHNAGHSNIDEIHSSLVKNCKCPWISMPYLISKKQPDKGFDAANFF